ncbi:MAG: HAMP domain-containing histidine kinase [Ruminococcus sp.]|nr:HAMP domain-containing histidine kinase [Ruminococcus sp.]
MKKIPDNSILKKEFTIPFFNMKTMRKIFKRNRKKPKIYKRKRKTFAGIFAKNALTALLLTVIFAVGLFNVGKEYIFSQVNTQSSDILSSMQQIISRVMNEKLQGPQAISARMRTYAQFNIVLGDMGKYQINSKTENCHVLVRLTDKDGNITLSSRMGLQAFVIFGEDDKEYLFCDTENKDFPELQQLEKDYMEMVKKEESFSGRYVIENYSIYPKTIIKSAYVNREEGLFIPHETELNLVKYYTENDRFDKILESKSYKIDMPEKDGYELIEFSFSDKEYIETSKPRTFMCGFYGTDRETFDKLSSENPPITNSPGGMYGINSIGRVCCKNAEIYIDGEPYLFTVILEVDAWNSVTKPLYFKLVTLFLIAMLVIALLDAWRHNVRNQADYRFEDYQKNLTDSLAHDLKTPLTAIGGYAENILSGSLSDNETKNYLKSIMDSVAYTDSIITRTLELSRMNGMNNIQKENTDINRIVEKSVEKYSVMLDERNITVNTDGRAEINTNVHLLETITENLVSNAVKYTSVNGSINIRISNESLSISNTIKHKVDIEKLKKPFAKGDIARSNQSGSGLGLAIAETASISNGYRLVLSCTDSEFTAEVKF